MIASLPMYQRPQLIDAHNKFWNLIRNNLSDAGIKTPAELSQDADEMAVWRDPELVLSQTCGMPYRTYLYDKVTLIGTPDFGVDDCLPGHYRSSFIVNKKDTRTMLSDYKGAIFAYNDKISQSGYAAAYFETMKHNFFFKNTVCSGGHLNSAAMVASKKAEIACIDPVSLAFMKEYEDFYDDLRIIKKTDPTPSLPYITTAGGDRETYFKAIEAAISDLSEMTRRKLRINGIVYIPKEQYLAFSNPPVEEKISAVK